MDPRKLFADSRMLNACAYCGGRPTTRDHVPSRVLLDDPVPLDLPVVDCCAECNNEFSLDEQYVACFIECALSGSASPSAVSRPKISRILTSTPALAARIAAAESRTPDGQKIWRPELPRVQAVITKLARGHAAYELSVLQLDEPVSVELTPKPALDGNSLANFLSPQATPFWPEIGSRAFIRACKQFPEKGADHWQVVQPGRYQYMVSQACGLFVRILLSDYLACVVAWD